MEEFTMPENNMFSISYFILLQMLSPWNTSRIEASELIKIMLIEDPILKEEEKLKWIQKFRISSDEELADILPKTLNSFTNLEFIDEKDRESFKKALKEEDYETASKIMQKNEKRNNLN